MEAAPSGPGPMPAAPPLWLTCCKELSPPPEVTPIAHWNDAIVVMIDARHSLCGPIILRAIRPSNITRIAWLLINLVECKLVVCE